MPNQFKTDHPEIPWSEMARTRGTGSRTDTTPSISTPSGKSFKMTCLPSGKSWCASPNRLAKGLARLTILHRQVRQQGGPCPRLLGACPRVRRAAFLAWLSLPGPAIRNQWRGVAAASSFDPRPDQLEPVRALLTDRNSSMTASMLATSRRIVLPKASMSWATCCAEAAQGDFRSPY
jgi:hypothetical protein